MDGMMVCSRCGVREVKRDSRCQRCIFVCLVGEVPEYLIKWYCNTERQVKERGRWTYRNNRVRQRVRKILELPSSEIPCIFSQEMRKLIRR